MLSEPTLDQLRERGLTGMIDALLELRGNAAAADLSHEEWLGLLLDRETTKQANKRMQSRLRAAKLRQQAAFEDVDYRIPRQLDRDQFLRLGSNQWIRDKNSLLITGACGLGKSYLACALGQKHAETIFLSSTVGVIVCFSTLAWPGSTAVMLGSSRH
jgi:DNA replication protein DnaC